MHEISFQMMLKGPFKVLVLQLEPEMMLLLLSFDLSCAEIREQLNS